MRTMRISEIAKTTVPPKWLRIPVACRYSGLSRSILYRLLNEGLIKSVCVRDKNKIRGIRLIAIESIDAFLSSLPTAEVPRGQGQKRSKTVDPLGEEIFNEFE